MKAEKINKLASEELQTRMVLARLRLPYAASMGGLFVAENQLRQAQVADWVITTYSFILGGIQERIPDFAPEFMARFEIAINCIQAQGGVRHVVNGPRAAWAIAYRQVYVRFLYEAMKPVYACLGQHDSGHGQEVLRLYRNCVDYIEHSKPWSCWDWELDQQPDEHSYDLGRAGLRIGRRILFDNFSTWYQQECTVWQVLGGIWGAYCTSLIYMDKRLRPADGMARAFLTALEAEASHA